MRVLLLTHQDVEIPDTVEGLSDQEMSPWKTEYDVLSALEEIGHRTRVLADPTELSTIRGVLKDWRPHLVFNLLEQFRGEDLYAPFVLGWLQLMRVPFTGCNPQSLLLVDNKQMAKKILRYHRIPVPDFAMFPRGTRIRRPARLAYPLIVKSATMHGSVGISQSSVVTDDDALAERVRWIHESLGTEAVAEQYVEGRELYVGMLGNHRLTTLPIWELRFENLAAGARPIATERVKWDTKYQEQRGIDTGPAVDLEPDLARRIDRICRRVYRILGLNGYARMDFRLTADGHLFLLEANPNPDLACDEDFAESAVAAGIPYPAAIRRIVGLARRYHREGH
jgi:D-alanine-D-alanine ligase